MDMSEEGGCGSGGIGGGEHVYARARKMIRKRVLFPPSGQLIPPTASPPHLRVERESVVLAPKLHQDRGEDPPSSPEF